MAPRVSTTTWLLTLDPLILPVTLPVNLPSQSADCPSSSLLGPGVQRSYYLAHALRIST